MAALETFWPALQCPRRAHWVSFRLVDENGAGEAFAGLSFTIEDSQRQRHTGLLDETGFSGNINIYCGPALLAVEEKPHTQDPWYKHLLTRRRFSLPITSLQIAAEQTPIGPRDPAGKTWLAEERAVREGARFYRVEVSDFVAANKHLPDPDAEWAPRPSALLKSAMGDSTASGKPGIALEPNQHHILEVKALRAYSPLFSLSPEFCALNAYHLSVMTVLSYAPFSTHQKSYEPSPPPYNLPGSIGHVLREQLARQIKPTLFDESRYHLLCEEVPYSKRLEVVPYDPERYTREDENTPEAVHFLNHEKTHTQAFATHNDRMILISIRGTEVNSLTDWLRDLDAGLTEEEGLAGKVHRGFLGAFKAVRDFVDEYLEHFFSGHQTLMICGHSLGGAIGLLLAEWLRKQPSEPQVVLYTFGAPRAGNNTFVESAQGLVHHRLVNHNDPIPAVPFRWMDPEWKVMLPGTLMLLVSSGSSVPGAFVLGGLANLKSDRYQHHGEQYHFMPRKRGAGSEASILWQPNSDTIELEYGATVTAQLALEDDMPRRRLFIGQLFAVAEHLSGTYTRAALANLLRLNASLGRDGELFTEQDLRDLLWQVNRLDEYLANWEAGSYQEFRHRLRTRHYTETYSSSETQLAQTYRDGVNNARVEQHEQRISLSRSQQRLLTQAAQKVTGRNVFGDLITHEELEQLLGEWRDQAEVAQAERMVLRLQQQVGVYA